MFFVLLKTVDVSRHPLNDFIETELKPCYETRMGRTALKSMHDQFAVIHGPQGKLHLNIMDLCQGPCIHCCSNATDLPDDATKYEIFQAMPSKFDVASSGFALVDTLAGDGKTFDDLSEWASCNEQIGNYDRDNHFAIVYLANGKLVAMNVESLAHGNRCGCTLYCSDDIAVNKIEIWKLV